jgi:Asp-tRNA(Asn)/Glu-tRNA(Gln) amidotransferase A subunit family amidase
VPAVASLQAMTATDVLAATRARELTCVEVVRDTLDRVARSADLGAWTTVGADQALAAAALLDRDGPDGRPLFGLPVGVKDIFDTADLPTAYGSPAYAGHQPAGDAAAVAALRRAGAIVIGKTVSTEFASVGPTAVANPIAPGRTPGGSSSGSAAAVAAGIVPIALGSQTAGSIIRPASYCAVIGYKPTFGAFSRAGVLPVADSLDTVGLFARTVADALLVARVLSAADGPVATVRRTVPLRLPDSLDGPPPRLGFARTAQWEQIEPGTQAAIDAAVEGVRARGARVEELALPEGHTALIEAQQLIQLVETAQSLARDHGRLSDELAAAVADGLRVPADAYWQARNHVAEAGRPTRAILDRFDAVLTPSAMGVPPALPSTGDPWLCRAWTALGTPSIAVPLAWTPDGLPGGLQVVAAPGCDDRVLRAAHWLIPSDCHTKGPSSG